MKFGNLKLAALALVAGVSFAACGDEEDDNNNTPDAGGSDTGGGTDTISDGSGGPQTITVQPGNISGDTTWPAGSTVTLKGLVFVTSGTLTIGEGVTIQGDEGSALVITRNAKIDAVGTANAPIVFTSTQPAGTKTRGGWGGVVMLGKAKINVEGGEDGIEGIEGTDDRGTYGGNDDAHDCGTLKYARIEFAGFKFGQDNELNGLTVAGCGTGTTLEYIQSHMGLDDGIEFFGGSAGIKYALITYADDDSLDWDQGWSGKAQFIAAIQDPAFGDCGIEADSNGDNNDATPRSNPTIWNLTLVGGKASAGDKDQNGMILRRGTAGKIRNTIVTGFRKVAIDVRDESTKNQATSGALALESLIVWDIGADGTSYFPADENDADFDEDAYFRDAARKVKFEDPKLTGLASGNLVPAADSPAASGAATPEAGFDTSATFIGAFEPGGENWAAGWTSFAKQ